jgi:threonine synthase
VALISETSFSQVRESLSFAGAAVRVYARINAVEEMAPQTDVLVIFADVFSTAAVIDALDRLRLRGGKPLVVIATAHPDRFPSKEIVLVPAKVRGDAILEAILAARDSERTNLHPRERRRDFLQVDPRPPQ